MLNPGLSWQALVLLALIVACCVWELTAPRRRTLVSRFLRWPTSVTLGSFNGWLMTVVGMPVALAAVAEAHGWGLGHVLQLPTWLAVALGVPTIDLVIYLQHRLLHAMPTLWAFHRVHHADLEVDYTTAFRFHPLEALLTSLTLLAASVLLGLPPLAWLVYQTLALVMTVLEHTNGRMPAALEARLGTLVITAGLHRRHHAVGIEANFGTIFSVWDRWCGTYRAPDAAADDAAEFGLAEFRAPKYQTLPWALAMPFTRPASSAADGAAAPDLAARR